VGSNQAFGGHCNLSPAPSGGALFGTCFTQAAVARQLAGNARSGGH